MANLCCHKFFPFIFFITKNHLMQFEIITPNNKQDRKTDNQTISSFLFKHLEQYGDKIEDIQKCIDYALDASRGGRIIIGSDEGSIKGITILNYTNMKGYIPENILVYIAVDNSERGKGYGKALMQKAIEISDGAIALHVEPENPARKLYEKLGFTNKYLEMRLQQ